MNICERLYETEINITLGMREAEVEMIVGTVALKPHTSKEYELTKMAVDVKYQGKKIGRALAQAAIKSAKDSGAEKIILYSNTMLVSAIALYNRLGFREIPVDGPYKRTNIKMELILA